MIVLKIILWIVAIAAAVGVIAGVADLLGKKSNGHKPYGPYERFIKRPLDAFLATGALIVLSPVLLVTALLVRVKLGSPVLFTQNRPGRDGKVFKLYKFRTMLPPKDGVIDPAQDAARLTPFGKKLRSTSMDGNVIIGQTTESLVNKGFREVSPIHFHRGRDLFSQSYYDFQAGGENVLVA